MARLLIFALPACGFVLLAYHLHSVVLGLLGIPGVVLTALLALAFGASARPPAAGEHREPWHLSLWICVLGAVLTAYYWIRVWAFQDWEMLGIPVLLTQIVGFWWPAVMYAMAVWFLEERVIFAAGRRRYWQRLAAGVLGGIMGIVMYPRTAPVYFQYFDRQPLRLAISSLQYAVPHALYLEPAREIPPPPVPQGGPRSQIRFSVPSLEFRIKKAQLRWRARGGHLFIEADLGDWKKVTEQQSLRIEAFRQQIPDFRSRAEELLARKDVRELTVIFRVGDGETLEFHRTEQVP